MAIADFERLIGYDLPKSLRELYLAHDGEYDFERSPRPGPGIFCGYEFRSLKYAALEYGNWIEAQDGMGDFRIDRPDGIPSVPARAVRGNYVRKGWIPFAGGYGGAQLAIDYMPDVNGNAGQVISFGRDDYVHFRLAGSFDEFLALVLKKYQSKAWHHIFMGHDWSLYDQLVLESGVK